LNYIVATRGGVFCFYRKDDALYWCEYASDGQWYSPQVFVDGGVINFTVSLCEGKILILSQSRFKVECIHFNKGNFTVNGLVESTMTGQYYGLSLDDSIFLVHNIPVTGEFSQILMSHRVEPLNVWTDNRHLGRVIPFGQGRPFETVPVRDQHFLLFYLAGNGSLVRDLGYREVYGRLMGDFNLIQHNISLNSPSCHTFLATTQDIHMAYVTKGLLSLTLNYVKKDAGGLGGKVSVAQGASISSPLLYIHNNNINIMFKRGEDFFVQNFDGKSLPSKLEKPKGIEITKSRFLCENDGFSSFFSNELFVNSKMPWEVLMLDGVLDFDDFINLNLSNQTCHSKKRLHVGTQEDYNNFFNESL